MMKSACAIFLVSSLLLLSCQTTPEFKDGIWRGVIKLQNQEVPFNFRVSTDSTGSKDIFLLNGTEELRLPDVSIKGNKVKATLHVFDAELNGELNNDSLSGKFVLNYRKNSELSFTAVHGQTYRFKSIDTSGNYTDYSGKYQVLFKSKQETIQAIGVFYQKGQWVTGTFLTPGGDYRYLEGGVFDDTLNLSVFDGNHTFLFKAIKKNDSTLLGQFWSHKNEYFDWNGIKKENPYLPDPEKLVILRAGEHKIDFCFPNIHKKQICLKDERYQNKVVIIGIFGTWCPNSMDVTNFLSDFYLKNSQRGIEVIGLAYERSNNFNYACERIKKTKEYFNIPYPVLVAGINDKKEIANSLPPIQKIEAIPSIIIIGKDHKVKYTYSGFSGPGTGIYYEQFKTRFNEMIDSCLAE